MKQEVMYQTKIVPKQMNTTYKTGNEEARVVTETIPLDDLEQFKQFYDSKH